MSSRRHRVRVTESAKDSLRRIRKRYGAKTYETVRDLIRDLESEPAKKGEPLQGVLRGLYSRHYSRFRIVYHIDKGELIVVVVGAGFHEKGSRKDIYALLERAMRTGRLVIQSKEGSSSSESRDEG